MDQTIFPSDDVVLREQLALYRTVLANERTFLAYLRTAFALILAGVTLVHFADRRWFAIVGIACVPLGALTLAVGVWRYRRMQRKIFAVARYISVRSNPPNSA